MEQAIKTFRSGRQLFFVSLTALLVILLWYWLTSLPSFNDTWQYIALGLVVIEIFNYGYSIPKMKAEGKLIIRK